MSSRRVVFVHGAWMTSKCWEPFRSRFEARGFTSLAPDWPGYDRPVAEIRAQPGVEIPRLGVDEIVAHYAAIVRSLAEPPLLVGHSFGGLFVQKLLSQGLGSAGVVLDPAPMRGIVPRPNAFRSALPVLTTWRAWKKAVPMSPAHFHWSFASALDRKASDEAYERLVVPVPGRLYFQSALGIGCGVDVRARRAPLLLVAGESDRTVPASMVAAAAARQKRSSAPTELKRFPGRSHFLIAEPGWQEVADGAIAWAEKALESPAAGELEPLPVAG